MVGEAGKELAEGGMERRKEDKREGPSGEKPCVPHSGVSLLILLTGGRGARFGKKKFKRKMTWLDFHLVRFDLGFGKLL